MRLQLSIFGIALDMTLGREQVQEPVTREQIAANMSTPTAQVEFGFAKPLYYPDERWTET